VHIDVLRGIAVFGMLLVNIWSFAWGFEFLRYGLLPNSASIMDRLAVFVVAFIAEQKFYPIFAFLFGAGFALYTGSLKRWLHSWNSVRTRYRRRLTWLLGCGILHGTLIWAGDILTLYSIAGFLILRLAGARLKTVYSNLWNWCLVWLLLMALHVTVWLSAHQADGGRSQVMSLIETTYEAHAIYTEGAVIDLFFQRLGDYANVRLLLLLPHILVLFLLGIMSVRLGWLTSPWRHTTLWRRVRVIGYGIGVPANLLWASMALAEASTPLSIPLYKMMTAYVLLPIGGSLLAAAYVASVMLASRNAIHAMEPWLAPVGRMALTNYLAQSVLCVSLLQGVGLGLGAAVSPAVLLLIAAIIMLVQMVVSRWWLARHPQGLIESLYHAKKGTGTPNL
jgi:uncharacterized protein